MKAKMYMCYGINGYKKKVYSNPHVGIAEPDEVEVELGKNVTIGENKMGFRCLYLDGNIPYPDSTLMLDDNCVKSFLYKSGDMPGKPSSGKTVTLCVVCEEQE